MSGSLNIIATATMLGVLGQGVVATPLSVPSRMVVSHLDMRIERHSDAPQARYRYIMPDLAPDFDFSQVSNDLKALCNSHALPNLDTTSPEIRQIVVSLSDRVVKYGEMDRQAVQVFETFLVEDGQCIWGDL